MKDNFANKRVDLDKSVYVKTLPIKNNIPPIYSKQNRTIKLMKN